MICQRSLFHPIPLFYPHVYGDIPWYSHILGLSQKKIVQVMECIAPMELRVALPCLTQDAVPKSQLWQLEPGVGWDNPRIPSIKKVGPNIGATPLGVSQS